MPKIAVVNNPTLPTSIRICLKLIFPETRVIGLHFCRWMYGSIFIQICAVGSKRRIFSAPVWVLAVQGRSGSSYFGTNRKRVCDFLLVGHCDYGPILHRFWDMVTYWLKIVYFSYPSLIRRPRSPCSLWNFAPRSNVLETRVLQWRPHDRSLSHFDSVPACDGQTDRQMDRQTDGFTIANTALCIASYADAL